MEGQFDALMLLETSFDEADKSSLPDVFAILKEEVFELRNAKCSFLKKIESLENENKLIWNEVKSLQRFCDELEDMYYHKNTISGNKEVVSRVRRNPCKRRYSSFNEPDLSSCGESGYGSAISVIPASGTRGYVSNEDVNQTPLEPQLFHPLSEIKLPHAPIKRCSSIKKTVSFRISSTIEQSIREISTIAEQQVSFIEEPTENTSSTAEPTLNIINPSAEQPLREIISNANQPFKNISSPVKEHFTKIDSATSEQSFERTDASKLKASLEELNKILISDPVLLCNEGNSTPDRADLYEDDVLNKLSEEHLLQLKLDISRQHESAMRRTVRWLRRRLGLRTKKRTLKRK